MSDIPISVILNTELQKFLCAIRDSGGSASRKRLPIATRAQDRARTLAKKHGLAVYADGKWHLTDAGCEVMR